MTSSRLPLVARGVNVRYRGSSEWRLRDFSAFLKNGEVLSVVGESGAGKSTLIRAIAGFVPVTGGALHVAGTPVGASARSLLRVRRRMGLILQSPRASLDPCQTALEAVAAPLIHLAGEDPQQAKDAARTLLVMLGVTGYRQMRRPAHLSGGECQRVSAARALIHKPALILADEPTASLDPLVGRNLAYQLQRIVQKDNLSMVYVTHKHREPVMLGSQLAVLLKGLRMEWISRFKSWGDVEHPYSRYLGLSTSRIVNPLNLSVEGCPFSTLCPHARAICRIEIPGEKEIQPGHIVRCFIHTDRLLPR